MSSSSTDELELGYIRFLPMQISTKRTASAAQERLFNLQCQLLGRKCYCSTVWAKKTILVWSFYKLRPHAMTARPSLGNLKISGTFTCPISPGLSPLKNTALKYAWSLARTKRCVVVILGDRRFLSMLSDN